MKKLLLVSILVSFILACGGRPTETLGASSAASTGSVVLSAGASPFISADLTSATAIMPLLVTPGGTVQGILVVQDGDRVNAGAGSGGGFKIKSVTGQGWPQIHDNSAVSWTSYDAETGGPVAFPPNPQPTGISPFISADLTSTNVIEAAHSTVTGGCLGPELVAKAADRVNAPAASGGGFRITSQYPAPNGATRTCDTSKFRWAVH